MAMAYLKYNVREVCIKYENIQLNFFLSTGTKL
jgi:hypothetical protein